MLKSVVDGKYKVVIKDGINFSPRYTYTIAIPILDDYDTPIDYELVGFELLATAEQVYQEWLEQKDLPPKPSEMELLKQEVESLKEQQQVLQESQEVQDFIIDDLVFEVIPTLESQIASDQSKVPTIIKRVNVLTKGMVQYLAKKISEGKNYEEVFKVNAYKQYQEEVDKILGRK